MIEPQAETAGATGRSRPTVANWLVPLRVRLALCSSPSSSRSSSPRPRAPRAPHLRSEHRQRSRGVREVNGADRSPTISNCAPTRPTSAMRSPTASASSTRRCPRSAPSRSSPSTGSRRRSRPAPRRRSGTRRWAWPGAPCAATRRCIPGKGVLRMVAVPARHDDASRRGRGTYSMASVEQLKREGRASSLWFVPAAIVVLTLLVDLATRRLIHRRLRHSARRCSGSRRATWPRAPRCSARTRWARWRQG